jgi:hypothetical protein
MDVDAAEGMNMTDPCKIAVNRPPDDLGGPVYHSIEFESNFSDASSVVINTFLFGNPGAPIPGLPQDPSPYKQFQAMLGETWTPFKSQHDWDLAHWAKTRNISSSAVDELLAILVPEVWAALSYHQLSP